MRVHPQGCARSVDRGTDEHPRVTVLPNPSTAPLALLAQVWAGVGWGLQVGGRPFWIFYRRLLRRNGWGIIPWDGKYPPVRVLPGWESCRVNCLVAARDGCVCMPLGKASNLAR